MSKRTVVNEIHRLARKNFKRRKTVIKGYRELFQADLAEFIPYHEENNGYKYILVVIDCFSKFLWTRPLKSKTSMEVARAMEDILTESGKPKLLQTDAGTEFLGKPFSTLMLKHNIKRYSTYSTVKASIAERVIRTLKHRLYKEFSMRGKYKWIDILQEVTNNYNHTVHRTIKMKPCDVTINTKLAMLELVSRTV